MLSEVTRSAAVLVSSADNPPERMPSRATVRLLPCRKLKSVPFACKRSASLKGERKSSAGLEFQGAGQATPEGFAATRHFVPVASASVPLMTTEVGTDRGADFLRPL